MKYDVVLITPANRAFARYHSPVSYVFLGGYLKEKGYSVKIHEIIKDRETTFEERIENCVQIAREASNLDCDLFGLTCFSTDIPFVFKIAEELKRLRPEAKIVAGGIHPTLYPHDFFFKNSPIDFLISGEGEIPLSRLIDALKTKSPLREVPGLYFKENESLINNPPAPIIEDIDEIAFPAHELLDTDYYMTPNPFAIRGVFLSAPYIQISRGCPSSCAFCVNKNLKNYFGTRTRYRSVDSVIKELKSLKTRYLIDGFYIVDDAFTLNNEYVERFCDALAASGLDLLWAANSRVTSLSRELIKKMRDCGCVQIDIGVESGSERILKMMRKGIKLEKVVDVFDWCNELGVRTLANFLFNYPGETEEDIKKSLDLMDRIRATIVYLNVFTPFPGCDVAEEINVKFSFKEYAIMDMGLISLMKKDPKFRFSKTNIDFEAFVAQHHFRYNKISSILRFMLSLRYLRTLLKSRRKLSYISNASMLVKEFLRQKAIFRERKRKINPVHLSP